MAVARILESVLHRDAIRGDDLPVQGGKHHEFLMPAGFPHSYDGDLAARLSRVGLENLQQRVAAFAPDEEGTT